MINWRWYEKYFAIVRKMFICNNIKSHQTKQKNKTTLFQRSHFSVNASRISKWMKWEGGKHDHLSCINCTLTYICQKKSLNPCRLTLPFVVMHNFYNTLKTFEIACTIFLFLVPSDVWKKGKKLTQFFYKGILDFFSRKLQARASARNSKKNLP